MSLSDNNVFSVALLNGQGRLRRAEGVGLQRRPLVAFLVGRGDRVRPVGQDVAAVDRRVVRGRVRGQVAVYCVGKLKHKL